MKEFTLKIGKALLIPITALPLAAIMLKLGQPDMLNNLILTTMGNALFNNLSLLFGLSIALGLSENDTDTAHLAITTLIGYLVFSNITQSIWLDTYGQEISSTLSMKTLEGVLVGILSAFVFNKTKHIKLSNFFSLFSGKNFPITIIIPISALLGCLLGYSWSPIQGIIATLGYKMANAGLVGLFMYGFLNRLLIPLGLHHVLNSYFWNNLGEFNGVTGDLNRFFAGDPTAGAYMAGFFPVMMFGIPAIALAFYMTAKKENKKNIIGLLASLAAISAITGVTEPLEFLFILSTPILLLAHATLTGLSMVLVSILGGLQGFTFSAGLIDYITNLNLSTNPWSIILVGMILFVLYYISFKWIIVSLNLNTIGRHNDQLDISNDSLKDTDAYSFVYNDVIDDSKISANTANSSSDDFKELLLNVTANLKTSSLESYSNSKQVNDISNNINDVLLNVIDETHKVYTNSIEQKEILNESSKSLTIFEETLALIESLITNINTHVKDARNTVETNQANLQEISGTITNVHNDLYYLIEDNVAMKNKVIEIKNIVSVIASIASKTNMLSLNAAIEAAHAGEKGAGFSVIAENVRDLAQESSKAANFITSLISDIIKSSDQMYEKAENLDSSLNLQLEILSDSLVVFSKTLESIEYISPQTEKSVSYIDTLSKQKNDVSEKINESLSHSETFVESTERVDMHIEKLKQSANELLSSSEKLINSAEETMTISEVFK